MMRIAACDAERKIKNVEAKDGRISWNFRPAQIDGFFVFFSTIAPRQYKSKGELLSCAEEYFREHMLEPERRNFYDLDGCKLQIIRKAVYNNGISIDETAAADAPIQIAVFPYTLRDGEITVYAQDESDLKNIAYIPYKIRYRKERKKRFRNRPESFLKKWDFLIKKITILISFPAASSREFPLQELFA